MARTLILILAALAVAVLAWSTRDHLWSADRNATAAPAPAPTAARPALREDIAADAPPPARTALGREPPRADDDLLRGVVLDMAGAPVAGADCRVQHAAADGFALLDRGAAPREVAVATTGADGRFAFELPFGVPHRLRVAARGFGTSLTGPHRSGGQVEVRLRAAATLVGRVTLDGAGVAATRVTLRSATVDGRRRGFVVGEARTDARGDYRIDGLESGNVECEVFPPRGAVPRDATLELHPGVEARHDVALVHGIDVEGRVLDAETGLGVADALVGLGWRVLRPTHTDRDGRFVYVDFPLAYADLGVEAPGYGACAVTITRGGEVQRDVEIRLEPARRAHGRVVALDGTGIGGAYVAACAYEYEDQKAHRIDWRATTSDPDGTFALVDLRADVNHVLLVRAEGYGVRQVDFPPDASASFEVALPDVVLEPGHVVRGRLVDEDGAPWTDTAVELRGDADGRRPRGEPAPDEYRPIDGYVALRDATTDADGRFVFVDVAAGSYALAPLRTLGRPDAAHPLRVDRGAPVPDVRLEMFRGLEIRGRVVVPDGGVVPHCYVSIDPVDGAATATDVECAPDGSFIAVGLARGAFSLTVYPYASDADRRDGRLFEPARVEAVAAGRTDVEVRLTRKE